MEPLSVEARAAVVSDLPGIVRCHLTAFPGQPMTELGPRWLAALYRYYLNHPEGVTVVAVNPERGVVGFVVGGGPDIRDQFIRGARYRFAPVILWRTLTRPVIRRRLIGRLLSCFHRQADGGSQDAAHREAARRGVRLGTLLSIAVLPEVQGTGAAGKLVAAFCDTSRRQGFGYLELGVYTSNTRAIAFYHKLGWHEIGRSHDQSFYGFDLGQAVGPADSRAKEIADRA